MERWPLATQGQGPCSQSLCFLKLVNAPHVPSSTQDSASRQQASSFTEHHHNYLENLLYEASTSMMILRLNHEFSKFINGHSISFNLIIRQI